MGALTRTHGAAADPATSRGSSGSKAANLTARTFEQLRDYFATQVSAQVSDPKIVMNLMRHTSLNTTTLYTRTVTERMKAAVRSKLGGRSWGQFWGHIPAQKDPKQHYARTAAKSGGEKCQVVKRA